MRNYLLTLALGSSLLACNSAEPKPVPDSSSKPATVDEKASDKSESAAKKLALAPSQGNSPIDLEITAEQKKASDAPKADAWILLGRSWVKKARATSDPGFYLNAKAAADVALELEPENRAAMDLLGFVYLNDHKFREAKKLAEDILARSPHDLQALGTLSDAENELGDFDGASKAVAEMMDGKPNLPSYIRAYYIQWLRGDIKAAQESVRLAIDSGMDRNDPEPRCWALVQAALLFQHQGDYAGADKGYELAQKTCSEYPPALVGRGNVAMAKDDYTRAAELFERAYKGSPLVSTAWLLCDAETAKGDKDAAAKACAEVVKRGKQSDGRTLAAFWSTHDEEHDKALELALAEKKVRDDIYTEDVIAWASYRAGKLKEAREAADNATKLGTKDAKLLYHAGAIRIAMGDKAAGEKLVKEALDLEPRFDFIGAQEAKKLLGQ